MKSLEETFMDSFFDRVDAGELISIPIDEFEVGDVAIFDNGKTPPEKIIIESFHLEWSSGRQVKTAKFGRSKYEVRYLRKANDDTK